MRRCLRLSGVLAAIIAGVPSLGGSLAETTPLQPASAQPTLAEPVPGGMPLTSPLLGGGTAGGTAKPLVVRKNAERAHRHAARVRRHYARDDHDQFDREPLERPALAGVQLVAPIPHPIQPPHFTVPVPAYPFENFITYYTTPPPPVICHRVPRDPYAPDPQLLYEKPVVCEADNP